MPQLLPALPLISGGIGAILNHGAQGKVNNAITGILNGQAQDYGLGRDMLFGKGGPGGQGALSSLLGGGMEDVNRQLQALYGSADNPGGLYGKANDRYSSNYDPGNILQMLFGNGGADPYGQNIPGVQDTLGGMAGLLPQLANNSSLASQVFAGGGWTPQSQQGFDTLSPIQGGQTGQQQQMNNVGNNIFNSNGAGPLSDFYKSMAINGMNGSDPQLNYGNDVIQRIINGGGQTDQTNNGIDAAMQKYSNGGMTDPLQALSGMGVNVLSRNGLTPTGAQGESAALQVLNAGGATPTTSGLQSRGLQLANEPSLLPPQMAASLARDQASKGYLDNIQSAQSQAIRRGGGPGTSVASGLQNSAMADYADKGSQVESQAMRDSLMQQQALQLQQANMGANMANQGGNLENNRFGTAANTLSSLEGVAANRFGLGGNFINSANSGAATNFGVGQDALARLASLQSGRQMGALDQIPAMSSANTNKANVFGNLDLNSSGQDLSRMNLGRGLLNDYLNSQMSATSGATDLFGKQANYAINAGGLANQGSGMQGDILSAILKGNFGAADQGLSRTNSYYGATNQGNNAGQNLLNFSGTQQNNGASLVDDLVKQLMGFTQHAGDTANDTRMSNLPGIGLQSKAVSPWSQFVGPALGLIGGGLQKLGGGFKGSDASTGGASPTYAGHSLGGSNFGAGPVM